MTLDLENRLRTALHDEADRAPLDAAEWPGRDQPSGSSNRRPWLAAASVAVIVTGGVGLATVERDPSGTGGSPPFEPEGDEYPLEHRAPDDVELGGLFDSPNGRPIGSPVKQGSINVVTWNRRTAVAYTSMTTFGRGIVDEVRCFHAWNDGSPGSGLGTCWPSDLAAPMTTPFGSWWGWLNVPPGTEFVQYTDGEHEYWQRPSGGVAIFPDVAGRAEQIAALDATGNVLAEADPATVLEIQSSSPVDTDYTGFDNLDAAQNAQVWSTAVGTMQTCLDYWAWTDPTSTQHPADEADDAWQSCLMQAQTAAGAVFAELGGAAVDDPADDPGVQLLP